MNTIQCDLYEITCSNTSTPYETISRNLCPLDANHRPEKPAEQSFFVDVSTFNKEPLNFTLKAAKMENFQIRYFM